MKKKFKLDKNKRIIECFNDSINIDVTIIEIIEKDNIDDSYFLLLNLDYNIENESFINKEIQASQYFGRKYLSLEMGRITGRSSENDYIFYHNADTTFGSSGSPILLKEEKRVIAIHKGVEDNKINIGIFIRIIIDIINSKVKRKKSPPLIVHTKDNQLKRIGEDFNGRHFYITTDNDKISDFDIAHHLSEYLDK